MNEYPQVLPATKMIGKKIVNRAGEELGVLKELVIDPEEGRMRMPSCPLEDSWVWEINSSQSPGKP